MIVMHHRCSTTRERELNELSFCAVINGIPKIHKARLGVTATLTLNVPVPATIPDVPGLITDAALQTEYGPNNQHIQSATFEPPNNHDNNMLDIPADKFLTLLIPAILTMLNIPAPLALDVPAQISTTILEALANFVPLNFLR